MTKVIELSSVIWFVFKIVVGLLSLLCVSCGVGAWLVPFWGWEELLGLGLGIVLVVGVIVIVIWLYRKLFD